MKNPEIFNLDLPNQEIRILISKGLNSTFVKEIENKKEHVPYNDAEPHILWAIKDAENDLKFHENRLQILRERSAFLTLMKMNDWEEFDVSDYTPLAPGQERWFSFIGTEKEYNELINKIENDKN